MVTIIYRLYQSNRKSKELLKKQNLDITEQREEILTQSEELTRSNQKLSVLNTELNTKNYEIEIQAEQIKSTNAELETINDQLEKMVEDRTRKLNKAYQELETFFYRTSHDFRRPLTTYLGLAEVAKCAITDKQALELFEKVRETTIGFDSMLQKLQSISNTGFVSTHSQVDLHELITQCCLKYSESMDRRKIKLTIDIPEGGTINSNPSLLRIAIENLVENSVTFSSPERPYITISAKNTDTGTTIDIEDNGQGIEDALQPEIFTMYYRANLNSKGNGLGLYVAKRAMEKLNGSISFKSTKYVGSSFQINIPDGA